MNIDDDDDENNTVCLYSPSFEHSKTLSALLTIFSLLSIHQSQAPFWGYTCAVMAANVAHTNLPEYTPNSVLSHLRRYRSVCMAALLEIYHQLVLLA